MTDKLPVAVDFFLRSPEPYPWRTETDNRYEIDVYGRRMLSDGITLCAKNPLRLTIWIYIRNGNVELQMGAISAEAGSNQNYEDAKFNATWLRKIENGLSKLNTAFGTTGDIPEKVARLMYVLGATHIHFYCPDVNVRKAFRIEQTYMRQDNSGSYYDQIWNTGQIREKLEGLDWLYKRAQKELEDADHARFESTKVEAE